MTQVSDLLGMWRCTYWYPSNTVVSDEPSEYDMKSYKDGDNLVLESVPNEEKSYMLVRLKITDDLATGNWHETTSPTGEFKGAQYSGTGQLTISPETHYMEGKWVGAGYDHKLKKIRIYSGNWEIAPIQGTKET
jgi:hypothetical protein